MFVRRKHYEQLVRDAAASQERERVVQLLVEQVEYLRLVAHHSTAPLPSIVSTEPALQFDSGISLESQPWVGEEEEDLLAMRQANVISEPEFQAALLAARQREHIIE